MKIRTGSLGTVLLNTLPSIPDPRKVHLSEEARELVAYEEGRGLELLAEQDPHHGGEEDLDECC